MIEIEKIMPLSKVEHHAIVSAQGDLTVAYEVTLPEIFTLSSQDYEAWHQTLVKAIRVLPPHSIFHKQDYFTKNNFKAETGQTDASFLSSSSDIFFEGRVYLDHRCYIFLTKKPAGRKLSSSAYSGILRKSIVPRQTIEAALFNDFMDNASRFERILKDSGFASLRKLTDKELAGTNKSSGIIEQYTFLQGEDEIPMIKDIHIKDGIRIGDNHCQLFTLSDVEDMPSLCGSRINYENYSTDKTKFSISFASGLGLLLDCNHIMNQYVFIEDTQRTLKALEKKRLRLQSLSAYSRENAIARDATSDFLNEAISAQRLPVKAHFNVMAWTNDTSALQEIRNKVGSAMARIDAVAKHETDGAAQIWWAGIPGNAADFPMNDTFDTFLEQATCFFNADGNYRSCVQGIRFSERLYGRPVWVDLFDEPMKNGTVTNRNLFVCGGSGGGKSMMMNHMLRSLYEQGIHCVTIDIGESYKGLCELVGGYYFVYTEENPIRFNPFYLTDGEVLDTEKKESLKNLLVALWKKEDETFRRSEYVAISNALTGYYQELAAHPEIFPSFNSFYEYLTEKYMLVLRNEDVKERDFDISNFLYVLNPFYKGGEYDYLLNAEENLDMLNERFIVFELDNVKNHPILFPVVTIIIMELFISKMRKLKGQRKILAIDEAWIAIAKSGMAEFIKYLYKTVRKFNGIAALITQEVDDLISSLIIKETVINLSDTKILLDMRKFMNKFDKLQEALGMSDKGKTLLLSVNKANEEGRNYRELLIDQGGQVMKVHRFEPSIEEYLAYSTEESEKIKVQQYARQYGSIQKGISVLANEMRRPREI
ncbi:Bacteroides conjugation system ATPase, TraG family [Pedobacter suwonensis]|uniref:Bacteroides conjugation system ATPase, TraG family n=1 Tax=Pedobacter suwonensis TaxID=332999 RepID=A0A1I0U2Z4_9SPHI|nr:TraG family conjugative transposon ATPase [Pedobacter suwonensis]SFA58489.1 Bacteroides conjugation system ATPase, TraG family [Pedobacter suwonensis]